MYSLSASHVIDIVPENKVVAASAAMILVNGLGAISGPIIATVTLTFLGPEGFWIALAIVHITFGLFAGYRLIVRRRVDVTKGVYPPISSRATLAAHRLLRDRSGPDVSSERQPDKVDS